MRWRGVAWCAWGLHIAPVLISFSLLPLFPATPLPFPTPRSLAKMIGIMRESYNKAPPREGVQNFMSFPMTADLVDLVRAVLGPEEEYSDDEVHPLKE